MIFHNMLNPNILLMGSFFAEDKNFTYKELSFFVLAISLEKHFIS